MKYAVDGALCSWHARCQTVASGVFDLDEFMVSPTVPEILGRPARTPLRR
jgi:hypothetical protein